MIKFFRDVLNGPLYWVVVLIAIILIMAIIGYLLEKKQKQEETNEKIVHVGREIKVENPTENINEIPNMTMKNIGETQDNNIENR